MAARNPSSFTKWLDEEALQQGKRIILTSPDQTIDDIEYCLDAGSLILADCFPVIGENGASFVDVIRYHLPAITDLCDVSSPASNLTCQLYFRMWVESGVTGNVRVQGGSGTYSETITGTTAGAWVKASSTYNIPTHDSQVDLTIGIRAASGADFCWIGGVMLVGNET